MSNKQSNVFADKYLAVLITASELAEFSNWHFEVDFIPGWGGHNTE